jgi:hypothetical protein
MSSFAPAGRVAVLAVIWSLLGLCKGPPTDGVDGPFTASKCQNGGRQRSPATGVIHGQYYNNRT